VLSLSILRTVPEAALFKRRLPEVGELAFGSIRCGGSTLAGQIHAIGMAQHIFGNGVKSAEAMGPGPPSFIHLNYGGRRSRD